MGNFEISTESLESRLVASTVIVRFKAKAMDILTKLEASADYQGLIDAANNATDVLGYVQINDSDWDSHTDIDRLSNGMAKDEDLYVKHGRVYGYYHDVLVARFRNTIGRNLLTQIKFSKPMAAGFQGRISGEYLGLTLAFDARYATADTTFSFDNVRTGIPASPGITYLMPRYIGIGRALELANRGATIDAHEALALGLISGVIDDQQDLTAACVEFIQGATSDRRDIAQFNRQHILPSPADMSAALDRYYDVMGKVIATRRAERQS